MKCSILNGGLRGSIQFFIFENFYVVFRWGQRLGFKISDFMKVLKMVVWVRVGLICVCVHKIIGFFISKEK